MQTKEGQSNGFSQSFSDDLVSESAIDSTMMTSLILLLVPSSGVNHIEHRVSKMDTLVGVAIKYGVKEEHRARDLFYALWVPELFMKRVNSYGEWSLFCPNEAPGLSDCWGEQQWGVVIVLPK